MRDIIGEEISHESILLFGVMVLTALAVKFILQETAYFENLLKNAPPLTERQLYINLEATGFIRRDERDHFLALIAEEEAAANANQQQPDQENPNLRMRPH